MTQSFRMLDETQKFCALLCPDHPTSGEVVTNRPVKLGFLVFLFVFYPFIARFCLNFNQRNLLRYIAYIRYVFVF